MIKDLSINKKVLTNKKRYILVGAMAGIMAATILMSGCNEIATSSVTSRISSTTSRYVSSGIAKTTSSIATSSTVTNKVISTLPMMNITDNSYNQLLKSINGTKVEYKYSNLYNLDKALSKYNSVLNDRVTTHTNHLENFTADALYDSVKKNNAQFFKDNKYTLATDFGEVELRNICEIIMDTVNYYKGKSLLTDISEIKCILGDLKILSMPSMNLAYVTDDNRMIISKAMNGTGTGLKKTICHETIHLLQKGCKDVNQKKYYIGTSYEFSDLSINPLYTSWFYEGSAEKCATDYLKTSPATYKSNIEYIDIISIATILKDGNYSTQPEDQNFKKELSGLFTMFGCQTMEEKKEILNMMYSIEIIQNCSEEHMKPIMEKIGNVNELSLKSSVCMTLTKQFYKNLVKCVKNKTLTLEDTYYMINLFENQINNCLYYCSTQSNNYRIGFMKQYIEIQDNFFYCLASDEEYTQSELESMHNKYSVGTSDILTKIDTNKQSCIKNRFKKISKSTKTISEAYYEITGSQKKR